MAEQSSNVIKYLFGMGVTVTINQTLAFAFLGFALMAWATPKIVEQYGDDV